MYTSDTDVFPSSPDLIWSHITCIRHVDPPFRQTSAFKGQRFQAIIEGNDSHEGRYLSWHRVGPEARPEGLEEIHAATSRALRHTPSQKTVKPLSDKFENTDKLGAYGASALWCTGNCPRHFVSDSPGAAHGDLGG